MCSRSGAIILHNAVLCCAASLSTFPSLPCWTSSSPSFASSFPVTYLFPCPSPCRCCAEILGSHSSPPPDSTSPGGRWYGHVARSTWLHPMKPCPRIPREPSCPQPVEEPSRP
ncbi:hypothetical protein AK812_SmicGene49118 [Symbiodinium microadriaticum]|uniref:Secreted protein n=1 Tax=Symbiodinium microadriaticum TaxID=2951 RepID=A0A1Q9DZ06_SYMMI|nr:hypothetical protein AK812_SmicGene49118 [Symbiodinium microadriaticum]